MAIKQPKPRKVRKTEAPIYQEFTRVKSNVPDLNRWLGYEGGNGKTGLIFLDDKSNLWRMVMPNARIMTTGETLDREWGETRSLPYAEFQGTRWAYSDAIFDVPNARIDVFQANEERYGSPEHVFPLLVMMAENDLPDGAYNLVVTVPPGYYSKVAERVEQGFMKGDPLLINRKKEDSGVWQIRLSADDVLRSYSFVRVVVGMEAADAGYAALRFDLNGDVAKFTGNDGQDMLGGRLRLIDLGFGTADTPTMLDGELVVQGLRRSSDERGGVLTNIALPVLNSVLEKRPEVSGWLTPAHIDYWMRRYVMGWVGADDKPRPRWSEAAAQVSLLGQTMHMKKVFDHFSGEYARYAYRKVAESQGDGMDTAAAIGGGWLYTIDAVRQWRQEARMVMQFITHEDVPHLRGFSFIDINLIGTIQMAAIIAKGG